jgi:hypothetical protein
MYEYDTVTFKLRSGNTMSQSISIKSIVWYLLALKYFCQTNKYHLRNQSRICKFGFMVRDSPNNSHSAI